MFLNGCHLHSWFAKLGMYSFSQQQHQDCGLRLQLKKYPPFLFIVDANFTSLFWRQKSGDVDVEMLILPRAWSWPSGSENDGEKERAMVWTWETRRPRNGKEWKMGILEGPLGDRWGRDKEGEKERKTSLVNGRDEGHLTESHSAWF